MAVTLETPIEAQNGSSAVTGEAEYREGIAARLLRAAARRSYNPDTDIEWPASIANDRFFLPEHRVSLYGTRLWSRMSPEQRILLSRHEVASMAQAGVWFELILGQLLIRFIYDEDYVSQHTRWALTEIADECRHSAMFARLVDTLVGHEHRPEPLTIFLGRFLKTVGNPVEGFADILIAEEILDMIQREAMVDQSIQPLIRAVSQLHVTEEARHVKFARDELARRVGRMNRAQLLRARTIVAVSAVVVTDALVCPSCYAAAGLNVREAQHVARHSKNRCETLRWSASKLTSFFSDIGLIHGPTRRVWVRAGLLAA
jgi:hypothetical protein